MLARNLIGSRQAIGLAEPEVFTRYLLWIAATGSFVLICGLAMIAGELRAAGSTHAADLLHGARGVLYLVICVCIGLGIFPNLRAPKPAAQHPEHG